LTAFLAGAFPAGALEAGALPAVEAGFFCFEIQGEGVNCFGLRVADERKREKTNLGGGGFGSHSD